MTDQHPEVDPAVAAALQRHADALADKSAELVASLKPADVDAAKVAKHLDLAREMGLAVKSDAPAPAIAPPAADDKVGRQLALARAMGFAVKSDPPPNAA